MIWCAGRLAWRPMTKRERQLHAAKMRERARERQARIDADRARVAARKRGSWERMKADIARKYAAT